LDNPETIAISARDENDFHPALSQVAWNTVGGRQNRRLVPIVSHQKGGTNVTTVNQEFPGHPLGRRLVNLSEKLRNKN
jgi:hypothetical protein